MLINGKCYFDFTVFYNIFGRPLSKLFKIKEQELINAFFEQQVSNYSEKQNGERAITKDEREIILSVDTALLSKRMESIISGERFFPENPIENIESQKKYCNESIFSLSKLAEIGELSFYNVYFEKVLQADDIETYEKVALLFKQALSVQPHKKFLPAQEREWNIIKKVCGRYTPVTNRKVPERYYGLYRIYYYSDHYPNEIHCGLLKIFIDSMNNTRARMIYGLNSIDKLNTSEIRRIMEINSVVDALEAFTNYKNTITYHYDRDFHLMTGTISSTDYKYYLKIDFSEVGAKSNNSQTLYLNLSRVSDVISEDNNYCGGLGLMVAAPHSPTPKIRTYKVGVASDPIPLSLTDPELKELLQLFPNDNEGIQIQTNDDSKWWHYILKREAGH